MAQKHFSISDLERIVSADQGGGHEPSRLQSGVASSYNPPKRELDIRRAIYHVVYNTDAWISRADIASALKLKKTNWLHGHIEQLVTDGYMIKTHTVRSNGMPMYWYAVPRGSGDAS